MYHQQPGIKSNVHIKAYFQKWQGVPYQKRRAAKLIASIFCLFFPIGFDWHRSRTIWILADTATSYRHLMPSKWMVVTLLVSTLHFCCGWANQYGTPCTSPRALLSVTLASELCIGLFYTRNHRTHYYIHLF